MCPRHRSNLRPTPSCCQFGQSTMKQMKSLVPTAGTAIRSYILKFKVVSCSVSRNPRPMLRSGNCFHVYGTLDVHRVMCLSRALALSSVYSVSYVNNLVIFDSGIAWPHIASAHSFIEKHRRRNLWPTPSGPAISFGWSSPMPWCCVQAAASTSAHANLAPTA